MLTADVPAERWILTKEKHNYIMVENKIKKSKITHISRQEMMYRHNKERVIELTNITPKTYHEMVFNTGCEFVDRLKNENKNRILSTRLFIGIGGRHEWKLFESSDAQLHRTKIGRGLEIGNGADGDGRGRE